MGTRGKGSAQCFPGRQWFHVAANAAEWNANEGFYLESLDICRIQYFFSPGLPHMPWLLSCPVCGTIFRLDMAYRIVSGGKVWQTRGGPGNQGLPLFAPVPMTTGVRTLATCCYGKRNECTTSHHLILSYLILVGCSCLLG